MYRDLLDTQPKEPLEPQPRSEYGRHRTSKRNMDETVLYARVLVSEDVDRADEEEADSDAGLPPVKMEDWSYDTRIDLAELLRKLPKGCDPGQVFLNLGVERDKSTLRIELIREKPRDKAKDKAEYQRVLKAWKLEHDAWAVNYDKWFQCVKAASIKAAENNLKRQKEGKALNKTELEILRSNTCNHFGHDWAAEMYAKRLGVSSILAEAAVDDFLTANILQEI